MGKSKLSLIIYSLFISIFFSTNFCILNAVQEEEQNEQQDLPVFDEEFLRKLLEEKDLSNEFDDEELLNFQDEFGEDEDFMMEQFQLPSKMAEKLPEELRKEVVDAWENGQRLIVTMQHPVLFLFEVCQKSGLQLTELLSKQEGGNQSIDSLIQILQKVQNFLNNPNLQILFQAGFFPEVLKNDLNDLCQEFDSVLQSLDEQFWQNLEDESLHNNFKILQSCLQALKDQDLGLLEENKVECLQQSAEDALKNLSGTYSKLEEMLENLTEEDSELKKAVDFWHKKLKEDFPFLGSDEEGGAPFKNYSSKCWTAFTKAAPLIEGGYAFYRKFFEVHNAALGEKVGWLPFVGDHTIRTLMVPIYFLKRVSQISQSGLGASAQALLSQQFMYELMEVYLNPNFYVRDQLWPIRAFYRLAPACAYYHTVCRKWDGENFDPNNLWKSDYKPIRRAAWFSMQDGYRSLSSILETGLKEKIDPQVLKNIEDSTLGIIKPDLISFIGDTAMPLLTYKGVENSEYLKSVADLKRKDVFKQEFWNLNWQWYYIGNRDFKNISDTEFVEGRVLAYLSIALGRHFGKVITSKFNGPIKTILSKSAEYLSRGLVKVGAVEQQTIDELRNMKDKIKGELKMLLIDMESPLLKMQMKVFFTFLTRLDILTQLDVAKFEKEMSTSNCDEKKISDFVDKFIERIISKITDKAIVAAGGALGAFVTRYYADKYYSKYGLFFGKGRLAPGY